MRWEQRYLKWLRAAWVFAVTVYAAGLLALIVDGEWEVAAAAGAGIAVLLFVGWHWRASSRAANAPESPGHPVRPLKYEIARGPAGAPNRYRSGSRRRTAHRMASAESRRVMITELDHRSPTRSSPS
jgi:hypothetical protein